MEEVTGLKERQVKSDIASKTNGDQASCKSSGLSVEMAGCGHVTDTDGAPAVAVASDHCYDGYSPSRVCLEASN